MKELIRFLKAYFREITEAYNRWDGEREAFGKSWIPSIPSPPPAPEPKPIKRWAFTEEKPKQSIMTMGSRPMKLYTVEVGRGSGCTCVHIIVASTEERVMELCRKQYPSCGEIKITILSDDLTKEYFKA